MALNRKARKDTKETVAALSDRLSLQRICVQTVGLHPSDKGTLSRILRGEPVSTRLENRVRVALGLPALENLWPYKDKEQRQRVREDERTLSQIIEDGLDARVRDDCACGDRDNTATS